MHNAKFGLYAAEFSEDVSVAFTHDPKSLRIHIIWFAYRYQSLLDQTPSRTSAMNLGDRYRSYPLEIAKNRKNLLGLERLYPISSKTNTKTNYEMSVTNLYKSRPYGID